MAKKDETTTAVAVKEEVSVTLGDSTINLSDMLERVSSMKEGGALSAEYWTPENAGEKTRAVFAGMDKMKKMNGEEGDLIDAVKLYIASGENAGKLKKNADKVIVSTLRSINIGTPISIEYLGKVKSPKGSYKTFKIVELTN